MAIYERASDNGQPGKFDLVEIPNDVRWVPVSPPEPPELTNVDSLRAYCESKRRFEAAVGIDRIGARERWELWRVMRMIGGLVPPEPTGLNLLEVLDLVIEWCEKRTSPDTADARSMGKVALMTKSRRHRICLDSSPKVLKPAQTKLESAFLLHHKFDSGSIEHHAPITIGQLAKLADVSKSTAKAFIDKWYPGGIKSYKTDTANGSMRLQIVLTQISGESVLWLENYGSDPDQLSDDD